MILVLRCSQQGKNLLNRIKNFWKLNRRIGIGKVRILWILKLWKRLLIWNILEIQIKKKINKVQRSQPVYENLIFDGQELTKISDGSLMDVISPLEDGLEETNLGIDPMETRKRNEGELGQEQGLRDDSGLGLDSKACSTSTIVVAVVLISIGASNLKLPNATRQQLRGVVLPQMECFSSY